jgi:GNAT superfamily N-acetyltransferase
MAASSSSESRDENTPGGRVGLSRSLPIIRNMTTIRAATAADAALILEFVRDLAVYEREPDAVKIDVEQLRSDGFPVAGGERYFECLIAEEDGEPAGIALFFPVYSTWRGRCLHLEDLFVRPQFRGRGVGKALLVRVAAIAVERGCARLFWHVLDWNEPAIEFYRSLGATVLVDWRRMQLADEALAAVAAGSEATA